VGKSKLYVQYAQGRLHNIDNNDKNKNKKNKERSQECGLNCDIADITKMYSSHVYHAGYMKDEPFRNARRLVRMVPAKQDRQPWCWHDPVAGKPINNVKLWSRSNVKVYVVMSMFILDSSVPADDTNVKC